MEVILLERVQKLGQMGDKVHVKDGYARNYLLPAGKALRANEANKQRFESQRAQLEARNLEQKNEAEAVGKKLDGESVIAIRQAGQTGQLYGSVSPRDISDLLTEAGFSASRSQVRLEQPIKSIGLHTVGIALHAEVEVTVTVNVARSPDEAQRQARGEDMSVENYDDDEEIEDSDGEDNDGDENESDEDQSASENAADTEEESA